MTHLGWHHPSVSSKGGLQHDPCLLFGTAEHGCESGVRVFSGSLNYKDFVKHLIFGLIQHLALLVPQSQEALGAAWQSNAILSGRRQSTALPVHEQWFRKAIS